MIGLETSIARIPARDGVPRGGGSAPGLFDRALDDATADAGTTSDILPTITARPEGKLRIDSIGTSLAQPDPGDPAKAQAMVDPDDPASMAAQIVLPDEVQMSIGAVPLLPARRQDVAGTGKGLPVDAQDTDLSKDVIWLPAGLVVVPPVAPPPPPPTSAAGIGGPAIDSQPAPLTPGLRAIPADGVSLPLAEAPTLDGAVAKVKPDVRIDSTMAPVDGNQPEAPRVRIDTAALPQSQSQPLQLPPPVAQPAGQAFAAAIASAIAAQPKVEDRDTPDARTPLSIAAAALDATHMPAVKATADAGQAALDPRQDTGLQGMIDHIEVLRDNADVNDTRIRLVPDALGAVDVSVRKDGDRVHVHFNAETQASARLLSDAQPRLAELAEARGVRLGQTSVDSGQPDTRQRPAPAQNFSAAPASTRAATIFETTDSRIA